ncbi:NAD(P)/FAD-dependent oxidoreductase [Salinicoccus siamensis]|uniref:NAD(P)/FAD-dependent oxidoreductase n=1 Tax=Salinicoccus siamensis TaxID=381830 RepID=A0ABV5Z612_9STAP
MFDTIIIGSGPAGLSAAGILKDGQNVLIIDEYYHPGGRLLGQLYEEEKDVWWNGQEIADSLFGDVKEAVAFRPSTSVINIEKDAHFTIHTTRGTFESYNVIVATGAREKSFPLPGWDLPGVMTVGAAQVLTNFQRVAPGDRGVIIGMNPLSLVIALELGYADIEVAKICLPPDNPLNEQSPMDAFETLLSLGGLAPSKFIASASRFGAKLPASHKAAVKLFPKSGVNAMGLPISIREKVTRINGQEQVESITVQQVDSKGRTLSKKSRTIPCDFVCISDGLAPLSEICSLLNMKHVYIESLGGYVPLHDSRMRTEIENLYVAGNITGIENAKVAMLQGELAASQILGDEANSRTLLGKINHERHYAKVKFHPELTRGKEQLESLWYEYMK